MSKKRQRVVARAYGATHAAGWHWSNPQTEWGTYVAVRAGVATLRTSARRVLLTETKSAWSPAGRAFTVEVDVACALEFVYLARARCRSIAPGTVMHGALLSALSERLCTLNTVREDDASGCRVARLFIEELRASARDTAPGLPWPRGERARRAAAELRRAPRNSLDETARVCGLSRRSLEREFVRETGLTLGVWARRARLQRAYTLLAAGASVTDVGLEVGYASTSAFINAFRAEFALTPGSVTSPV